MLALLALVLAVGVTVHELNLDPRVTIPGNVLPSPNAYDYYVRAGKAVVDSRKISEATGSPLPDKAEAPTLAAQETLVRENAPALSSLRAGFAYPYMHPAERSLIFHFADDARMRGIARLLRLEGQVKAAHGDWGSAAESNLDTVRLGEDMPHGSGLIGMLVGVAVQAIGRNSVWAAVPQLTAPQARAAARRLEAIQARHTPFADTMQQEAWSSEANIMAVFRDPHWRKGVIDNFVTPDSDNYNGVERVYAGAQMLVVSKRAIFSDYTGYMNQIVHNARLPYAAKPPLPPLPHDPLTRGMLPLYAKARLIDADRSEAQNALLTAALAVRAYTVEHGRSPDTLAALVPAYLSKVPDDPFALSGPLRSVKRDNALVVYSVGPDGKDDGGRAINNPAAPADKASHARLFVNDNSTGDIVAGVNIY